MTSKYEPLHRYLTGVTGNEHEMSFAEIENILGFSLPASARKYIAWWDNPTDGKTHPYTYAWLDAGWKRGSLDLKGERVTFVR
jgi:hypothetical protein